MVEQMRQPDDPGPVYRPSTVDLLLSRWREDWKWNRHAMGKAATLTLFLLAIAMFLVALTYEYPPV